MPNIINKHVLNLDVIFIYSIFAQNKRNEQLGNFYNSQI